MCDRCPELEAQVEQLLDELHDLKARTHPQSLHRAGSCTRRRTSIGAGLVPAPRHRATTPPRSINRGCGLFPHPGHDRGCRAVRRTAQRHRSSRGRTPVTLTVGSLFAAHLGRGFSETLSDLDALGFDAEWSTVSACSVGAAHPRRRLFAVAYSYGIGESVFAVDGEVAWLSELASRRRHWGNATADDVGTDDGVPHRLDRLRALGNAVVPQVAEFVGRRIVWAAA